MSVLAVPSSSQIVKLQRTGNSIKRRERNQCSDEARCLGSIYGKEKQRRRQKSSSFEISNLPKMTVDFSVLIKISFHRLFCPIPQLRLICSSFEFRSYYDKSDDLWIDLENWEFLETQGNLAFYVTALLEYVHLRFLRIFL